MFKIIPLEKKYLKQASDLANSVFPDEKFLPSRAFEASLDKEKFNALTGNNKSGLKSLEYFVAVDDKGLVAGTTGLYFLESDCKDSCWLGWYCVGRKYRGKGIGKLLLDHSISEAKKRGKKFLKLYTSTNPNEADAQTIYEKNDFRITKQKRVKQGKYEIFFREKKL